VLAAGLPAAVTLAALFAIRLVVVMVYGSDPAHPRGARAASGGAAMGETLPGWRWWTNTGCG